jgi:acetyl esterase
MPVDPFLEPLLAQLPEVTEDIDYPTYRPVVNQQGDDLFAMIGEPGPDVKERREVTIPVAGGPIDLYIYQPFEPGPHPAHLFLHGGGWSLGTIRTPNDSPRPACRSRMPCMPGTSTGLLPSPRLCHRRGFGETR